MQLRKHCLGLASVIVLASTLAASTSAQGGPPPPPTNVLYGFVTSNRTLTYATPGPDYFIPGDLVVNSGVTLTIEPGVRLLFTANRDTLGGGDYPGLVELDVLGHLIADAASGDSIRMVSLGGGEGQWGQVRIEGTATATMRRVAVQGARVGVLNFGQLALDHSSFSCSSTGIFTASSAASIGQCVIADANAGINGQGGIAAVSECVLRGNGTGTGLAIGDGMTTAVGDSLNPTPTVISGYQYGVQTFGGPTVSNIVAHHNIYGVYASAGTPTVNYCTVVGNSNGGVNLTNNAGRVFDSIIAQNGGYGVYLSGNCAFVGIAYDDSWASGAQNFFNDRGCAVGPNLASFDPFFVNPAAGNYHLASGSVFKIYGPWGAEIGAYGPGPDSPVPAHLTSWGKVKATYR